MKSYSILYVGDLNNYSRDHVQMEMLKKFGHHVTAFSHTEVQENKLGYRKVNLFTRIAWKLGFQFDTENVGKKILGSVESDEIDIVWIEKGNMIHPWVLKELKSKHPDILLVASSYDDMYAKHNRTWFYTFGLKYYDVVFTTKSYNCNLNELPRLGAKRVVFLYQSYELDFHYPIELSDEDRCNYGAAVSFIGCYEKERAQSLLYLAQHGISVRVWGNGWERSRYSHPNVHIEYKPVINDRHALEYTKTICASDINLCFLRKMNRDLHTTRSIEIPACGGFMLAERTVDHLHLFEEGEEAAFFSNDEELLQKIQYYLAHPEERRQIAEAGRQRCLQDDYSNQGQLKLMLQEIKALLNKESKWKESR